MQPAKILSYLALMAIILMSGCIDNTGGSSSDSYKGYGTGVSIESFSFSADSYEAGMPAILTLDVKNKGAKSIDDMYVYLYGLSTGENEWFDDLAEMEVVGDAIKVSELDDSDGKTPLILKIPRLDGPRPSLDMDGQESQISWILDAPKDLPKGKEFSYTAGTRVCYPYETTSIGKIDILNEDEYKSQSIEDEIARYKTELDSTAGPIDIDILTEQPVILSDDNEISFRVRIKDVGGGTLTMSDCSHVSEWEEEEVMDLWALHDKIDITLAGKSRRCDVDMEDLYFRIPDNGPATADFNVICDIPDADAPRMNYDLKLKFNYNYFVDRTTDISVVGVEMLN